MNAAKVTYQINSSDYFIARTLFIDNYKYILTDGLEIHINGGIFNYSNIADVNVPQSYLDVITDITDFQSLASDMLHIDVLIYMLMIKFPNVYYDLLTKLSIPKEIESRIHMHQRRIKFMSDDLERFDEVLTKSLPHAYDV